MIDIGLVAVLQRVKTWLHERDRLEELGDAVHVANGYELRVSDLQRLVERLERLPEVSCECHPLAEGKERSDHE